MGGFVVPLVSQQQTDQKPPTFEVASIKPTETLNAGGTMGFQPGGRFRAVNIPVSGMIAGAYRTEGFLFSWQIVGGPDWLSTQRYDVTAKVTSDLEAKTPVELFPKMPQFLQSLLEDRFKLRTHRETRQLPTFALVLARKDGMLGPKLQRSTLECFSGGKPNPDCKMQFLTGHFVASSVALRAVADLLSNNLERIVVDRTGLTGTFDIDLEWSPDQATSDQPSLVGALQEQLGLKLESTKGPVDVLVIDHVERPTPD
jgi:uncharacterized protein (TIGR03435 family)